MTSGARTSGRAGAVTYREKLNSSAYGYYGAATTATPGGRIATNGMRRLFAAALLSSTSTLAFGLTAAPAQAACTATGPVSYVCSGASTSAHVFSGDDIAVTGDSSWNQNTTGAATDYGSNTAISITGNATGAANYGTITTGAVPSATSAYARHHGLSVIATDGWSYALNGATGTITTSAHASAGLYTGTTTGSTIAVNDGLLQGTGRENTGIEAKASGEDGTALARNRETGVISMTGDDSTGMQASASQGTATARNDGSIDVTGANYATGIYVSGDTVVVTNNGLVEVDASFATGIFGESNSDATTNITNNGTVIANGEYATAIRAVGPTVNITNAEGATITSDYVAIAVERVGGGTIANYGTVTGDLTSFARRSDDTSDITIRNGGSIDGMIDFRNAVNTHVINHGGSVGNGSNAISVGYGNSVVEISGNGNTVNGVLVAVDSAEEAIPETHSTINFSQTDTLVLSTGIHGISIVNFDAINFNGGVTLFSGTNVLSPNGAANINGGAVVTTDAESFGMDVARLNVSGEGSLRGTLLAPAGSWIGVTGDIVFGYRGRLQTGIDGDDDSGWIAAEGSITFEDGSEIYADVRSGISLEPGGGLLVARAGEGIYNNGLAVFDNSILYDFTADLQGSDLYLLVRRVMTAIQATNDNRGSNNARSIADAIDKFLESAPTDNPIAQFLSQFPEDEQQAQLFKLVQDSLPPESGETGSGSMVSADLVLDLIMDRLSGGGFAVVDNGARETGVAAGDIALGGMGNFALWGRIGGSRAEYTPGNVNGFDADTFAASLGIDGDFSPALRAGIALFYTSTKSDETGPGANSSLDIEGLGALLYGSWRPSDFYVNATFGYGFNSYDSQRLSLGGTNVADYDGTQVMARVETGKVFAHGAWDITPNAGLRFNRVSVDGYTETGPLPTAVDAQDVTSLRAAAGFGVRYTHKMENGGKLIPEAYLRGLHELADPGEALTGTIAGGGTFVSQTAERDRFSVAAGGGITYEIDDRISLRMLYDGEFQSDYKEHSLTAALRIAF